MILSPVTQVSLPQLSQTRAWQPRPARPLLSTGDRFSRLITRIPTSLVGYATATGSAQFTGEYAMTSTDTATPSILTAEDVLESLLGRIWNRRLVQETCGILPLRLDSHQVRRRVSQGAAPGSCGQRHPIPAHASVSALVRNEESPRSDPHAPARRFRLASVRRGERAAGNHRYPRGAAIESGSRVLPYSSPV